MVNSKCVLDESNMFAFYMAHMDSTLQLELSFQNNATVIALLFALPDSMRLTRDSMRLT